MADKLPTKTAEVNILGVYPPKLKPKWGSIKVDPPIEGTEWADVWHENLTEFDVGSAIISYTTKDKDDGGVWVTARRSRSLGGKQAAKGNGGLNKAPGKPAAVGGEKDRLISLLALLKPMLENGITPSPEQAKEMCDRAISMYEYVRLSNNPQHAEDMQDDIPH